MGKRVKQLKRAAVTVGIGAAGAVAYLKRKSPTSAPEAEDLTTPPPSADLLSTAAAAADPDTVTAGAEIEADQVLVARVHEHLDNRPEFGTAVIDVSADAGIVTLRGTVDIAEHGDAIAAAVVAVPGVAGVDSFLHDADQPPPATPNTLR